MKTIKKTIVLGLTLILSVNAPAMEKKENALEKMTKEPMGHPDLSGEVGMELQVSNQNKQKLQIAIKQLKQQLTKLRVLFANNLDKKISDNINQQITIVQKNIDTAYRMYFGDTSVNLNELRGAMKLAGINPDF